VFSIVHQDSWKFGSLLLLVSEIQRSGHIDRGEVATPAQENSVSPLSFFPLSFYAELTLVRQRNIMIATEKFPKLEYPRIARDIRY